MRRVSIAVLTCMCFCILGLTFLRARGQEATPVSAGITRQDYYGFDLNKLKLNHQGANVVHISVLYRYPADLPASKYPDVNAIRNDLLKDITNYPNTTDYWEIYDSNLVDHLFTKHAAEMEAIRVKIEIAPGPGEPFARTSLVTRSRAGSAPIIP